MFISGLKSRLCKCCRSGTARHMYAPLAENESPPSAGGRAGVACARRAPTDQHSTSDEDLDDHDDHLSIFRELDSDDILHSNWEIGLVLIKVYLRPKA